MMSAGSKFISPLFRNCVEFRFFADMYLFACSILATWIFLWLAFPFSFELEQLHYPAPVNVSYLHLDISFFYCISSNR